jgi:hypothetical protein
MPEKIQNKLNAEWQNIKKDWYHIYQWGSLQRKSYSNIIAHIIVNNFDCINLVKDDLRQNNFKIDDHCGQAQLSTGIKQITEKRFLRALFNFANEKPLKFIGKVIDYEVPLKEKRGAQHGDIDLLACNNNNLFVIEAKKHDSSESILKAILEAYVYSRLVHSVKERFYFDFGFVSELILTPTILTFESATSGEQLLQLCLKDKHPNIKRLLNILNKDLEKDGLNKFRFFIITNKIDKARPPLEKSDFKGKGNLVLFKKDFVPDLKEIKIS